MSQAETMTSGANEERNTALHLTERDFEVLVGVHGARYLTAPQIQSLYWRESRGGAFGRLKACQRRLRQLTHHGLLRRIEQPVKRGEGAKPFIYALGKKGAELLISELGSDPETIEWRPRSQEENYPFLAHLLATTDFRIAVGHACERAGVSLLHWRDEKALRAEGMFDRVTLVSPEGKEHQTAVIPDAVFQLERGGRQALFFVEIDLRTMVVEPTLWERKGWSRKVQAYTAYLQSETYAARYENRRVRILTITTGRQRLAHLQAASEKVGGDNRFWFTIFEEAREPAKLLTERIWQVAGSNTPRSLLE